MSTTEPKEKLSDLAIIRQYLQTQDAELFSMLYDRYSIPIYSKCISLLKNEAWAKDATQEIFVKIFRNLARFEGQSKFSTWVYSITYNFCIDQIRKKKKRSAIFSDDLGNVPDVVEDVDEQQLLTMKVERLKVVLDEIPVGDKAVLLMKYMEGMQIREIAETLQKSESAIKMKIKRAKQKAMMAYKDLYDDF